jgi:hypothetical protein
MLIATNRYVNEDNFKNGVGDQNGFGEKLNSKGANELRFARASQLNGKWVVELVEEPKQLTVGNLPSQVEFKKLMIDGANNKTQCVFYIHGFNKPFVETLEQGWFIHRQYGVEVVLFSWPSNPGGIWPPIEYRDARRIAMASFGALDSLFDKFGGYLKGRMTSFDEKALLNSQVTTNLMTHSLGAYLFENYVLNQAYRAETKLFTNVILSQADVNNEDHMKWVDKIFAGQRTFSTVNENDAILGWSEEINPPRLGKTLANLISTKAQYFDFTRGKDVGNKHQLWGEVNNNTVRAFFSAVLNGKRGDEVTGYTYDSKFNAYRINESS